MPSKNSCLVSESRSNLKYASELTTGRYSCGRAISELPDPLITLIANLFYTVFKILQTMRRADERAVLAGDVRAANCPQAARMSRPRGLLTNALMPFDSRTARKDSTRSADEG